MRLSPRLGTTLILLGAIVTSAGCATLTKEQCTMGNWQAIGYTDGVAGYYADRLASHAKACAKTGVSPDYQAWERGRQQGLKQYCTPTNAYELGRRGQQLNGVCPANMANQLQQLNAQGREYYTLNNQLLEEQRQLEKYQDEFKRLREGELLDFKSEKEARSRLLSLPDKIRSSRQRIANAEERLRRLDQLPH